MKSYTDIEQSKKLISLGLDSSTADMEYISLKEDNHPIGSVPFVKDDSEVENSAFDSLYNRTPCWSLTALLGVISNIFKYHLDYNGISFILTIGDFEVSNKIIVDACYEMVLKLHKLNLL